MAGEVSAADGALKAGAAAVAQTRVELKGELASLEGKLAGIGSSWKGQGAASFGILMNRWREDANKITDALNEFEANLQSSQTSYVAADDAQSSAMGRLTSRLG